MGGKTTKSAWRAQGQGCMSNCMNSLLSIACMEFSNGEPGSYNFDDGRIVFSPHGPRMQYNKISTDQMELNSAEGYIKFKAQWTSAPPLPEAEISEINHWRQVLYDAGFIGAYPNGIGFGNISARPGDSVGFIISGSATGNLPTLDARHYCTVTRTEAAQNTVWCEGPIVASSESMSHAAVYTECPEARAVVHAHHRQWWARLLHRIPTTRPEVAYGSPEMAEEIVRLLRETELRRSGIFVTEGHEEGIFALGRTLKEAAKRLINLR